MAASLNNCQFIGRMTRPPETREAGGTTITNIAIACNEKYKDKSGEWVEKCEFVNIVFFGKLASVVAQYTDKGKEIYVAGRMTTERYTDKAGVEKFSTKIIGEKLQLLGGKSEGGRPAQQGGSSYEEPPFDPSGEIPF